ncbi:hypothetical protein ACLKA6_002034 [Drosophila palustris]
MSDSPSPVRSSMSDSSLQSPISISSDEQLHSLSPRSFEVEYNRVIDSLIVCDNSPDSIARHDSSNGDGIIRLINGPERLQGHAFESTRLFAERSALLGVPFVGPISSVNSDTSPAKSPPAPSQWLQKPSQPQFPSQQPGLVLNSSGSCAQFVRSEYFDAPANTNDCADASTSHSSLYQSSRKPLVDAAQSRRANAQQTARQHSSLTRNIQLDKLRALNNSKPADKPNLFHDLSIELNNNQTVNDCNLQQNLPQVTTTTTVTASDCPTTVPAEASIAAPLSAPTANRCPAAPMSPMLVNPFTANQHKPPQIVVRFRSENADHTYDHGNRIMDGPNELIKRFQTRSPPITEFSVKLGGAGILRILPQTSDAYRQIIHVLKVDNTLEYNTYQHREDRSFRVVVQGIHVSVGTDAIRNELTCMGYTVRSVHFPKYKNRNGPDRQQQQQQLPSPKLPKLPKQRLPQSREPNQGRHINQSVSPSGQQQQQQQSHNKRGRRRRQRRRQRRQQQQKQQQQQQQQQINSAPMVADDGHVDVDVGADVVAVSPLLSIRHNAVNRLQHKNPFRQEQSLPREQAVHLNTPKSVTAAAASTAQKQQHRQQEQRQTNNQNDHLDPNSNFIELFKRQQIQIDRLMDGMAKMQQIVAAALSRSGDSTASAPSSPNQ